MNNTNPLKEIQKVYMLSAFGILLLAAVSFYLIQSGNAGRNPDYMDILFKAIPMSIVIGLSASFYLGNKHLKTAISTRGLSLKLGHFRQSTLIKNVCLAIPAVLASVAAILTGETQFLFISLAILVVMLIAFPSKNRVISLLKLEQKDITELDKLTAN